MGCFLIFQIYILVLCVVRDCFLVDRRTLSLGSSFENKGFALISRMIEMASKKFCHLEQTFCFRGLRPHGMAVPSSGPAAGGPRAQCRADAAEASAGACASASGSRLLAPAGSVAVLILCSFVSCPGVGSL